MDITSDNQAAYDAGYAAAQLESNDELVEEAYNDGYADAPTESNDEEVASDAFEGYGFSGYHGG